MRIAPWSNPNDPIRYQWTCFLNYWKYRFDNSKWSRMTGTFRKKCHYCGGRRDFNFDGWRDVHLELHGRRYTFHYRCFQFVFERTDHATYDLKMAVGRNLDVTHG